MAIPRISWHAQQRRAQRLRIVLLSVIGLTFAVPLLWTLLASVGVQPSGHAFPPTLDHYLDVGIAEPNFWRALLTSSLVSALATLLTMTIAFPAAYSLARASRRSTNSLLQALLVLASLPVMAYVIPLSDIARRMHLLDNVIGVMLAQTAAVVPLAAYVLYGYLARLPVDVEEAAILDGASLAHRLSHIVLPIILPGAAATAIIALVLHWNMLLIPLVLNNGHIKTIPLAMIDFFTFERELEWPTAAAALVVSLLPLISMVLLAYRLLARFRLSPGA